MTQPTITHVIDTVDESLSTVILSMRKCDIELYVETFEVIKTLLSMNDNELLYLYDEITTIMDNLTVILLNSDSSHIEESVESSFNIENVHPDMIHGYKQLKHTLNIILEKLKKSSVAYKNPHLKYDEPNEVFNKFLTITNIIIESLENHALSLVSYLLTIIIKNIIQDEKDRLMYKEMNTGLKNNENIIIVDSDSTPTSMDVLFVSKNNDLLTSKMHNKRKKYLINIKNNTCTCLDFKVRKWKQGLCCKHLMALKNKTYCLMLIDKIFKVNTNSHNTYLPMNKMLKVAYDKNIDYKH